MARFGLFRLISIAARTLGARTLFKEVSWGKRFADLFIMASARSGSPARANVVAAAFWSACGILLVVATVSSCARLLYPNRASILARCINIVDSVGSGGPLACPARRSLIA